MRYMMALLRRAPVPGSTLSKSIWWSENPQDPRLPSVLFERLPYRCLESGKQDSAGNLQGEESCSYKFRSSRERSGRKVLLQVTREQRE